MSRKDGQDLLAQLDELSGGAAPQQRPSKSMTKSSKTTPSKQAPKETSTGEDDLAELEKLAQAPSRPSRPSTPRLSSSTASGTNKSPKRAEHTPSSSGPPSGRTSEDRLRSGAPTSGVGTQPRKSGESTRSFHQSFTPGTTEDGSPNENFQTKETSTATTGGNGGGWWGSMFSAASAAVKQAETLAKEIRGNEEAQKWADQVRGRVGDLKGFSTDLRSRALPTFTSLLQHIAPPISAHERLQIHITHDIQNYPSLDPLIYNTFSRIMSQVEGGDLLVIQKGTESRSRSQSEPKGYSGGILSGGGWSDGPWWRDEGVTRNIGAVAGVKEGSRLTRVSAESYAKEYFDRLGGLEEAAKRATETLSESNPTRSSDIFLALQAIQYQGDKDLFAGDMREQPSESVAEPTEEESNLITFAVYLYDPIHSLSFSATSQPLPQRWIGWLDASSKDGGLPDSIEEMIAGGGVDPREWVAEWLEEVLGLSVGIVAQQYVARRMGVGEGGLGKGKQRVEEEGIGGESARAL